MIRVRGVIIWRIEAGSIMLSGKQFCYNRHAPGVMDGRRSSDECM